MITNVRTRTMRARARHGARASKRLATIAAGAGISIGAIGAMGSPAAADRPAEFEDTFAFSAINPCTDTPMEVTIHSVVRWHEHGDRFVAHVARTGSTDDGYVMDHGVETALFNGNVFRQNLTDNFRNEDGSKFQARGVLVDSDDGVRVDRFTVRCLDR